MRIPRFRVSLFIIIMVAVSFASALIAQDTCPAEVSCPTIQLPEGFIGDFYLGDVPLAVGQSAAALQVPVLATPRIHAESDS